MNIFARIKNSTYEQRLLITTATTATLGLAAAVAKILFGVFFDPILCAVGAYGLFLTIAKIQCVLGAAKKRSFEKSNLLIALFLFLAGLGYIGYMSIALGIGYAPKKHSLFVAVIIAAIAFFEMGLAIRGLVKTKKHGHLYRDMKIISFSSAASAILTAQIALLSTLSDTVTPNFYTGIGLGAVTCLLAVYVYFAPRFSTFDREHNVFVLKDPEKNTLVDMESPAFSLPLKHSRIYGKYEYRASVTGDTVDGHIVKHSDFFKRQHILVKILLIILSEILVFVYAVGYAIWFCRTADMPTRLKRKMQKNGFEYTEAASPEEEQGEIIL